MKKRIVGMLVALIMICGILPAYAAGGIAPTEETWYVVPHSGDYRVYYYAAVTNNSSEPEKVKDLLFEIRDRADTAIESTAKYKLYHALSHTILPDAIGLGRITPHQFSCSKPFDSETSKTCIVSAVREYLG